MKNFSGKDNFKLSIVIPCYNEEKTLEECVNRVLEIADCNLFLEFIIVDDHSTDNSYYIASEMGKDTETGENGSLVGALSSKIEQTSRLSRDARVPDIEE